MQVRIYFRGYYPNLQYSMTVTSLYIILFVLNLLNLILCFFLSTEDVHNFVKCSRKYSKLGCFSQSQSVSEVPLLTYRDKTSKYYNGTLINWRKFKESLHRYITSLHYTYLFFDWIVIVIFK